MGGASVPVSATVGTGKQTNLSVDLTAPAIAGNYTGSWRLQNATGAYFGDILTVVITVSGSGTSGGTVAPTSTP